MAQRHRFKVNKLIRDKIPEIMRSDNIAVFERVMDIDEYVVRLKDKLFEEAGEVCEANDKEFIKEELADLLEVILALGKVRGLSYEEIEAKRCLKKEENGGFECRLYSPYIEIDADNKKIDYYLSRPKDYPEEK